ncbi:DUF6252 family protein [Hymenobacter tibetensis]|uniref:DUF6252 family protein n=1 Tax=Hymenobacter tibetensis TaxID=497967 RepID=A0ABY4CZX7_9BACT|nr:DUF6252 family protein [Hymenobacter tibetensis]UOG75703.1 DUF6252 family protein [Hymenobacter tibetensis]
MSAFHYFLRSIVPLLGSGLLLLSACGDDKDDNDAPATGDGTVTWTHNGTTYTSTVYSVAVVDGADKIIVSGSSADMKNTVSLGLQGIGTKGAATYDLRKGSVLDNLPVGALTLTAGTTGVTYNSLYGPAVSNGTITVTQYDKAGQKISGTFSFTAGAMPNTSATGSQSVTSGSFSFTKFR